jgi:hypothetical protein
LDSAPQSRQAEGSPDATLVTALARVIESNF